MNQNPPTRECGCGKKKQLVENTITPVPEKPIKFDINPKQKNPLIVNINPPLKKLIMTQKTNSIIKPLPLINNEKVECNSCGSKPKQSFDVLNKNCTSCREKPPRHFPIIKPECTSCKKNKY